MVKCVEFACVVIFLSCRHIWCLYLCLDFCVLMSSGTHEKSVLEAGLLEKLIDAVIELSEKDEDNVSVINHRLTVLIITMILTEM